MAKLEQAYQQDGFQLFVVYGPEDSGKEMLLQEFYGWKRRIFFKASGKDTTSLLNFAERVLNRYENPRIKPLTSWESIFKYIADNEKNIRMSERLVLVLHEFPDPVRRDDKFMSMFKDLSMVQMTNMYLRAWRTANVLESIPY